jgi:hypothetical protein
MEEGERQLKQAGELKVKIKSVQFYEREAMVCSKS